MMGEVSSILLATDGTTFSDGAVQEALFFAQSCGAKLKLLHAIKIDQHQESSSHTQASAETEKVAPHLDRFRDMAESLEVNYEVILKNSFDVPKTIVDEAVTQQSDVIIMGRVGKTGFKKLIMGSVTSKVIGLASPKVLVVPTDFTIAGQSLLIALDGSPHSEAAASEAISMCCQCPAIKKVVALSVAESEDQLTDAETLVNDFKNNLLAKKDSVQVETITETGIPDKVIIDQAKDHCVDLIVIGGYGRSGVSKLLMGSVTEKVIALAHCGILVVNIQK